MSDTGSNTPTAMKTIWAKTLTELAAYQIRQTGNNCSFHAISVGIQLLLDYKINPNILAQEINRQWWCGHFMRIFPNWAVTPHMQVRIIDYLAKTRNLPIRGTFRNSTPSKCFRVLSDSTCVPIITTIWLWGQAPPIFYGDRQFNFNKTKKAQRHTMVLATHDPNHLSGEDLHTPCGFINSWRDHA